jgi:hypothetical protein
MKSPSFPPARPGLSLRQKYAEARADLEKWSMLATAPIRAPGDKSGLTPEASVFANKVARGYAAEVDLYERALMRRSGDRLPKELQSRLDQISTAAALPHDKRLSWSRVFRAIAHRLRP